MSKFEVKLIRKGVRELMHDPAIDAECRQVAEQKAETAGPGYTVEKRNYPSRIGYAISAETPEAVHDNFVNNTLLKLTHGG